MVDAKFIVDDLEVYRILQQIKDKEETLWLWQNHEKHEKRKVHYGKIVKIDQINKKIEIRPNRTSVFKFNREKELFGVSGQSCFAFRVPIKQYDQVFLTFPTPHRLNQISGELMEKLQIVEKENEQKYAHLRTAPRKGAKEGQMIGLRINEAEEEIYPLYDISQGGLAFKVVDPGEVEKGDKIKVIQIDGTPLPQPIVGVVMSIRQLESGSSEFKVGVKFST